LGVLDNLIAGIKDTDANVRAMKAWAIGRLGPSAGCKAIKPLLELLKDNYWKVKTSACIAIGCIGEQAATHALPLLLKVSFLFSSRY
jgi:HEAT repeat protein